MTTEYSCEAERLAALSNESCGLIYWPTKGEYKGRDSAGDTTVFYMNDGSAYFIRGTRCHWSKA